MERMLPVIRTKGYTDESLEASVDLEMHFIKTFNLFGCFTLDY